MENKKQLLEIFSYTPGAATNYTLTGNEDVVRIDGTTHVGTILLADAIQTKGEVTISHVAGTNYTVVKSGSSTLHTFGAVGHIHAVSTGSAWVIVK